MSNNIPQYLNMVLSPQTQNSSYTSELSLPNILEVNVRKNSLGYNYVLISNAYRTIGLFRLIIDRPVYDALSDKVFIKSSSLSKEQIDKVQIEIRKNRDIRQIINAIRYSRLYGGSVIYPVFENLEMSDELDYNDINQENINDLGNMTLISYDRWQIGSPNLIDYKNNTLQPTNLSDIKSINGKKIDPNRLILIDGIDDPYYNRMQNSGWGTVNLEYLLRTLNCYIEAQNLIFLLLYQNKLDIIKTDIDNTLMTATQEAYDNLLKKLDLTNMLKNSKGMMVLDNKDNFERNQISLSGVDTLFELIKDELCAVSQIPRSVLFGESSGGLHNDDPQWHNYYTMIDTNIRSMYKDEILACLRLRVLITLGFCPDDLDLEFESMVEEDREKKIQSLSTLQTTLAQGVELGLYDVEYAREQLNASKLLYSPILIKDDTDFDDLSSDYIDELDNRTPLDVNKEELNKEEND